MGTIVAKFRNRKTGKTYTAKVEGGACVVPAAAMAYPQMDIALYGTDGTTHMTTSILQVPILKSDLGDGIEPVAETSVFDTIMSTANHAMQTAQSVRDDAAEGAFNGTPFRIVKQYASIADMEADTSGTVSAGEFVIITSSVEDPDNSKLFLRTETGWSYINDMSGAQGVGIKGDKGDKGDQGDKGDKGDGVPDGGTAGQYLRKTATSTEWGDVTAAGIGAAQASHKHPASDLTSTLGIGKGGTSATTAEAARANLGAARNIAGIIHAYAGSTAPDGYLMCDGQAVSRTTYAALFAAIGTTYGAGDGSTTFNLPDLQGRFPLGAGAGNGLTARTVGQKDGEEVHALTADEMPAHTHTASTASAGDHTHGHPTSGYRIIGYNYGVINTGVSERHVAKATSGNYIAPVVNNANVDWGGFDSTSSNGAHTHTVSVDSAGGGGSHNNMPPYTVVAYIISTGL